MITWVPSKLCQITGLRYCVDLEMRGHPWVGEVRSGKGGVLKAVLFDENMHVKTEDQFKMGL